MESILITLLTVLAGLQLTELLMVRFYPSSRLLVTSRVAALIRSRFGLTTLLQRIGGSFSRWRNYFQEKVTSWSQPKSPLQRGPYRTAAPPPVLFVRWVIRIRCLRNSITDYTARVLLNTTERVLRIGQDGAEQCLSANEKAFNRAAATYWVASIVAEDDPQESLNLTLAALEHLRKNRSLSEVEWKMLTESNPYIKSVPRDNDPVFNDDDW